METPCRRVADEDVVDDLRDNNKIIAFEDRSLMVATPPPSYHYAVSTSNNKILSDTDAKEDDPWLARMNSLDETMLEMRRAVEETQSMMKDMQTRFETSSHLLLRNSSSIQRRQRLLRSSKSFTSSSCITYLSDSEDDDDLINKSNINIDATTTNIDNDDDSNDDDDMFNNKDSSSSSNDDLDRITESLKQLIEQAQSSLKTRLAIRDRSTMMHRSNSCPQISTIYSAQRRRQSETDTPSTPQLFDWNDQRERFFDSQSRLTQAIQELALACSSQDNLSIYSPSHQQLSSSSSSSSPPHIVHHHYHQEHHHHHYYHEQQQQSNRGSHIFNYTSLLRAISNSSAVAAAARRLTNSINNSMNNIPNNSSSNHSTTNKPLVIHPPRISLSKPNLIRLMFYITLLIFSFMNQQQLQQQHYLSKKCIAARRCVGQFVSHASDNLPISTWIQHSTLLVYVVALL